VTKSELIALADVIRAHPHHFSDTAIVRLAEFCHTYNPRFDSARWLAYIHTGKDRRTPTLQRL